MGVREREGEIVRLFWSRSDRSTPFSYKTGPGTSHEAQKIKYNKIYIKNKLFQHR